MADSVTADDRGRELKFVNLDVLQVRIKSGFAGRRSIRLTGVGRFLRRTLAAMSLILLLGTVGLWVRSYWVEDSLEVVHYTSLNPEGHRFDFALETWRGRVTYFASVNKNEGFSDEPSVLWRYKPAHEVQLDTIEKDGKTFWGFGGLDASPIIFPMWFPALLLSFLPFFWLRGVRSRRRGIQRWRHGLCVECGYDLRASNSRCPECGREIDDGLKPRDSWGRDLGPTIFAIGLLVIGSFALVIGVQRSFNRQYREWNQYTFDCALRRALSDHDGSRIEAFLQAGAVADPRALGDALRYAVLVQDERLAIRLLDAGADLSEHGIALVEIAAYHGWYDFACDLVERGVAVNGYIDDQSSTMINWLAQKFGNRETAPSELKLVVMLLVKGADPNLADNDGDTPLHRLAAIKPDLSASDVSRFAQLLIDHGASIDARNKRNETPLGLANSLDNRILIDFLKSKGAKE